MKTSKKTEHADKRLERCRELLKAYAKAAQEYRAALEGMVRIYGDGPRRKEYECAIKLLKGG